MALWALVVVVPLLTAMIYLYVGSPQLIDMKGGHQAGAPASMEEMILSLQQRLEQSPDDPNGWYMLGRSYMATEQYPQAASAFGRVNVLVGGEEPVVLLALANALILSRQGDMAGRPTELVRKAVKLAPDSATALWLAGAVEKAAGNSKQALAHWRKLLPLLHDDPETEQQVRALIAELEGEATTK
jgi:cytochrome c-type biogenesis protein CcmH